MWFWGLLLSPSSNRSMEYFSNNSVLIFCKELSFLVHTILMMIHLLFCTLCKFVSFIFTSIFEISSRGFSWKYDVEKVCSISGGKPKISLLYFLSFWTYLHILYTVVLGNFFTFLAPGNVFFFIYQLYLLLHVNMLQLILE